MTSRRELDENITVSAVPAGDTDRRLAAIIRRHGGRVWTRPKPGMVLPTPKRGHRKGQLTLPLPLPGYRAKEEQ